MCNRFRSFTFAALALCVLGANNNNLFAKVYGDQTDQTEPAKADSGKDQAKGPENPAPAASANNQASATSPDQKNFEDLVKGLKQDVADAVSQPLEKRLQQILVVSLCIAGAMLLSLVLLFMLQHKVKNGFKAVDQADSVARGLEGTMTSLKGMIEDLLAKAGPTGHISAALALVALVAISGVAKGATFAPNYVEQGANKDHPNKTSVKTCGLPPKLDKVEFVEPEGKNPATDVTAEVGEIKDSCADLKFKVGYQATTGKYTVLVDGKLVPGTLFVVPDVASVEAARANISSRDAQARKKADEAMNAVKGVRADMDPAIKEWRAASATVNTLSGMVADHESRLRVLEARPEGLSEQEVIAIVRKEIQPLAAQGNANARVLNAHSQQLDVDGKSLQRVTGDLSLYGAATFNKTARNEVKKRYKQSPYAPKTSANQQ